MWTIYLGAVEEGEARAQLDGCIGPKFKGSPDFGEAQRAFLEDTTARLNQVGVAIASRVGKHKLRRDDIDAFVWHFP